MKVLLKQDVRNLGKVGELVSVKPGYARNFLFPKDLAMLASEGKIKEFNHLQRVAEAKKAKAVDSRKALVEKLNGLNLSFTAQAPEESDKIFGSINAHQISEKLSSEGFEVDKKDIVLEDTIKLLGQHKAKVSFGEGLEADLSISVERESN